MIYRYPFESSVNSYDSQTLTYMDILIRRFESSVNSYDSQTQEKEIELQAKFESSVNSYDSQTCCALTG